MSPTNRDRVGDTPDTLDGDDTAEYVDSLEPIEPLGESIQTSIDSLTEATTAFQRKSKAEDRVSSIFIMLGIIGACFSAGLLFYQVNISASYARTDGTTHSKSLVGVDGGVVSPHFSSKFIKSLEGGVRPAVRFLANASVSQNPDAFKSLVCLKAFLAEVDLSCDQDMHSAGISVDNWQIDHWVRGSKMIEQHRLTISRSQDDQGHILVIPLDCGLNRCDGSLLPRRVTVNGRSGGGAPFRSNIVSSQNDTLHWLIVEFLEDAFIRNQAQTEIRWGTENPGTNYSLAVVDVPRMAGQASEITWSIHFSEPTRDFLWITWDSGNEVFDCDPRRLVSTSYPFEESRSHDSPPDIVAGWELDFPSSHVVYVWRGQSRRDPLAAAFDQEYWSPGDASSERQRIMESSAQHLRSALASPRVTPLEVFASCEVCTDQEPILQTLEELGPDGDVTARFLLPRGIENYSQLERLLRLSADPASGVECRIRATDEPPLRVFGVYDPDYPERSRVSWMVVPSEQPGLAASFRGYAVTNRQLRRFDEQWNSSLTAPCPAPAGGNGP
ncbi:MAG: hypothetical protein KJ626_04105 [Verrucomicrobia bacterium]|nr:hypothetical protein [Verrucomicrobiota bacterium]